MKKLTTIIISVGVIFGLGFFFLFRQTPLADIPQSKRCKVMCDRRDLGSLENLKGKTRDEIRGILGDPQNSDVEGEVWLWLFQWDAYKARGLPRDWRTMAANSPASGLWIRFELDRCIFGFPYSFAAADPLHLIGREPFPST